jgi:hypothetical protein
MIAYKLFRQLKNGEIAPLFINKKLRLSQNVWYNAESHRTKGFAFRPGFHVTSKPVAPHLSEKDRVWKQVEIEDYVEIKRPDSQGGLWMLAQRMKVLDSTI